MKQDAIFKRIEELKRWLERVKVLKVVFMALIGIRLIPGFDSFSVLLTVSPIALFLALEETRIRLDSRIRQLQQELSRKEKQLAAEKSKKLRRNRKNRCTKDQ